MTTRKKLAALPVLFCAAFCLTACGLSAQQMPQMTPTPDPVPTVTLTPAPEPIPTPEPWPESWYEGYRRILGDWTVLEDYGDLSYLPQYFGDDYGFDSYFLCDVDGNGTPELFLDSSTMGLTAVLSYDAGPMGIFYDRFDINKETGELIVLGHWHGAGGSGIFGNEWRAWKLCGTDWEMTMFIDCFEAEWIGGEENRYDIYDPETGEYNTYMALESSEYDALYDIHVTPRISFSQYRLYALDDLSGLETVQ